MNTDRSDFTKGSILKKLSFFMLPVLGALILQAAYGAVACMINIAGDLLLVAGFGMDAAGAAIATVMAQAVSVVFALIILIRKKLPFSVAKTDFRFNPQCGKFLYLNRKHTQS